MFECVKNGLTDLFRNKLRTFLTVGGIIIGVLSVVIISTVGDIGKKTIDGQLNNMGLDNIVVTADKNNSAGLMDGDLASIKSVSSVQNAMPLMNIMADATVRNNTFSAMIWGVNEDANNVIELEVIHGRLIDRGDVASNSKVCVIDEGIAMDNYKRSNIVGKEISININGRVESLTVVGVVKNGVNILQSVLGDIVPSFIYVPYTTFQDETLQEYFNQIAVKLKGNKNIDDISDELTRTIITNREVSTTIKIDNLLQQKEQLNNILEIITIVLSAIAGISLLVSGLSIMTVMLTSVKERTREIGIKKSIGAKSTDILLEFIIESVLITFIGGIVGAIIGVSVTLLACLIFQISPVINFGMIWLVIGISVGIGLIFGSYPAYRASKLSPVEALRYE